MLVLFIQCLLYHLSKTVVSQMSVKLKCTWLVVYIHVCVVVTACLCGVIAQTNIHSSQKSDFLPQKLDFSEVSLHCRHVQRTK